MSKYTTDVRHICEFYAGLSESTDFTEVDNTIDVAQEHIFQEYPIFDEEYREQLNHKILKHYYTREICEETVGLWKLRLNARMAEIMPYYNKLYSSELYSFNPFYDVDLHTSHDRSENTESNGTSTTSDNREITRNETESSSRIENAERTNSDAINRNSTNSSSGIEEVSGNANNSENEKGTSSSSGINNKNNIDKYSDTPQGGINGLESGTYLTNARIIESEDNDNRTESTDKLNTGEREYSENRENNSTGSTAEKEQHEGTISNEVNESKNNAKSGKDTNEGSTESSNENHIGSVEAYAEHVYGKRGGTSYAKMLQEFRDTFLNIDKMIIDDLSDLFFGLWE